MVTIRQYEKRDQADWDRFITESNNGTFLFYREYMEYHADRFQDHSLLFYAGEQLVGVLPANVRERELYSHGGLTYGGLITNGRLRVVDFLACFKALVDYQKAQGFTELVYKLVPPIYHQVPDEREAYTLFLHGASLIRRGLSSSICIPSHSIPGNRRGGARKAIRMGMQIAISNDYECFMEIVATGLSQKYELRPVHSAKEIALLAGRFPENIKLYAAILDGEMVGGALMYETPYVAHAQYLATTQQGKKNRAMDLMIIHLVEEVYCHKRWFDFGISTDHSGLELNEGLLRHKEEYGSTSVCYDVYSIKAFHNQA